MEAMTLGYPLEQKGHISVTATREEWQGVIKSLTDEFGSLRATAEGWTLIDALISQGVYG